MKIFNYYSFKQTLGLAITTAGFGDLIVAICMQIYKTGLFPDKLLYYIAGGILGLETSMKGGFQIGFLGLIIHFFITFCFTIFLFGAVRYLKLYKLKSYFVYLFAIIYTFVVNIFMNRLVMQNTMLPPAKPTDYTDASTWIGHLLFTVLFSFPIVYFAYRYYSFKEVRENY